MSTTAGSQYPADWDERRRKVYRRDDYRCQECGAGGGPHGDTVLHCHHKTPISRGGSHEYSNLVTVCEDCHERIHGRAIGREPTRRDRTTGNSGGLLTTIKAVLIGLGVGLVAIVGILILLGVLVLLALMFLH